MNRPAFTIAWAASQRIYDPLRPADKVAEIVGGAVAKNIHNPDPRQKWKNTCAVRMSYILNQSGVLIPLTPDKTVTGADKRNYFYRVKDLISFLGSSWGKPEIVKYPSPSSVSGKRGVILFEVSGWSDAGGHAALFDGHSCYDHCYFYERETTEQTTKANFLVLQ